MKPKPGDISIVDKTGTFLMWYDRNSRPALTFGALTGTLADSFPAPAFPVSNRERAREFTWLPRMLFQSQPAVTDYYKQP